MFEDDQETCSLTLRTVWKQTRDVLYEIKTLTGEPICRLINKIVRYYFENHPEMLTLRIQQIQELANEYSSVGATDPTPNPSDSKPQPPLANVLKRLSAML